MVLAVDAVDLLAANDSVLITVALQSVVQFVTLGATVVLGLIGWGIKRAVEGLLRRLDCIEKSQHACQIDNAEKFATIESVDKLRDRVDQHESRVSAVEARLGK